MIQIAYMVFDRECNLVYGGHDRSIAKTLHNCDIKSTMIDFTIPYIENDANTATLKMMCISGKLKHKQYYYARQELIRLTAELRKKTMQGSFPQNKADSLLGETVALRISTQTTHPAIKWDTGLVIGKSADGEEVQIFALVDSVPRKFWEQVSYLSVVKQKV